MIFAQKHIQKILSVLYFCDYFQLSVIQCITGLTKPGFQ
jgi:hypothetical protein